MRYIGEPVVESLNSAESLLSPLTLQAVQQAHQLAGERDEARRRAQAADAASRALNERAADMDARLQVRLKVACYQPSEFSRAWLSIGFCTVVCCGGGDAGALGMTESLEQYLGVNSIIAPQAAQQETLAARELSRQAGARAEAAAREALERDAALAAKATALEGAAAAVADRKRAAEEEGEKSQRERIKRQRLEEENKACSASDTVLIKDL